MSKDTKKSDSNYRQDFIKFISQLSSTTGDLSQMTCPAFLLSGYSLLEYSQHWGEHPDLLYKISDPNLTPPGTF
jgi:hypothetical protein